MLIANVAEKKSCLKREESVKSRNFWTGSWDSFNKLSKNSHGVAENDLRVKAGQPLSDFVLLVFSPMASLNRAHNTANLTGI